ncbi:MAG TPA: C25 family cysteine peptidase [bacterium]
MIKVSAMTVLLVIHVMAGVIQKTFTFNEQDIAFSGQNGYDIITWEPGSFVIEPGSPLLPKRSVYFVIPYNSDVLDITVKDKDDTVLPGSFNIHPGQMPVPFSDPSNSKFIGPDAAIYGRDALYPENSLTVCSSGMKSGFQIAGIDLYPIRYNPASGKVIFTRALTVSVVYGQSRRQRTARYMTPAQFAVFLRDVSDLVVNPEDVQRFAPAVRQEREDDIEYVIITSASLSPGYSSLADWRSRQGWRTAVIDIEWIHENYDGYDDQERIRNFLKEFHETRGLIWVVLGGDADIVPVREAYLPYQGDPYLAADLYYADLDGTWDANGNHQYGEFSGDSVDLFSDVFVGRIPAGSAINVADFFSKLYQFERDPPGEYLQKMLLPSVMLFPAYDYHGRVVNNTIADTTPEVWQDSRLEDQLSTLTPDSLSSGYQVCHIAATGDQNGFYTDIGSDILHINQVASLANGPRYDLLNSIAGYVGDFDEYDCLAESLINKYPGACVAAVVNVRNGWGTPPVMGPSENLDVKFLSFFFNQDTLETGRCLARSKDHFRNDILSNDMYRYCGYSLNLLGDPVLPMWESIPESLSVTHPANLPMGSQTFNVTVTAMGTPVANALVGIHGTSALHARDLTDISGQAHFSLFFNSPGFVYVTVTGKDRIPYEGTIRILAPEGAYLQYLKSSVDDAAGNNNGELNPGETIGIPLWIKNIGPQSGSGITGTLRTADPLVWISDSVKSFGDVPPDDSAFTGTDGFDLTLAGSAVNGHAVVCTLMCRDDIDSTWSSVFSIPVHAPQLVYCEYAVAGGNNNGILDPGETANMFVTLKNAGGLDACTVSSVLSDASGYITVSDSLGVFPDIAVDSSGSNALDPYLVAASVSTPPGTEIDLCVHVTTAEGYSSFIAVPIVIGAASLDFATHDAGESRLTMTRYGTLGFMGSDQTQGLGFHYPSSSTNHLYYGCFAAGSNAAYCVDRYYEQSQTDDQDWNTSTVPDGRIRMFEPGPRDLDEYCTARYDDSGHPFPRDLVCEQYSWAWGDEAAQDFIIIKYVLENEGTASNDSLYAALFADWDIGNYMSNQGAIDTTRNLTCMWRSSIFVGVAILDPPRSIPARNISLIDHDTYIYPYGGLPDSCQMLFMDGTVHIPASNREYDWSTCNSTGPFTLLPGGACIAAFAVIGGHDLNDLCAHADTAYERYWTWTRVAEYAKRKPLASSIKIVPLIARQQPFKLYYNYDTPQHLSITLYDITGRAVYLRDQGVVSGHGELLVHCPELAQGIYFIKVKSDLCVNIEKVIWMK